MLLVERRRALVRHERYPLKESDMAKFMRALRVSLNIHPNEPSSLWKHWDVWIEF
jgi:hypothetical protein